MSENRRKYWIAAALFLTSLAIFALLPSRRLFGQAEDANRMVTQTVNNNLRTMLRGSVYPLARAEFDQGSVPGSMPINHRTLVLRRPPQLQAALDRFDAEQQDPTSANYHHWLTPQEFGEQFGASDTDIEAATNWLSSQGFTNIHVANGRGFIDFSGTAGQFNQAFQTSIHYYSVRGRQYWANASNPTIPTALVPLVAGIAALHDFPKHPAMHIFSKKTIAPWKGVHPAYSFPSGCVSDATSANLCGFGLSPGDFGRIYNVLPLWNAGVDGSGVTIAVIGQSNVNLSDIAAFRSIFGLAAKAPTVTIVDGTDPGTGTGDESESDLDLEWSGAIAPNANINLVTAATENGGVDAAANFAVDNNVAPIITESYDACELDMGTAGNLEYDNLWQMAQTDNISVLLASGDSGSSGCDFFDQSAPLTPQPAEFGLAVSGLSSTPFDVAVGGTDFDQFVDPGNFWSTTNTTVGNLTEVSANGYIPETTWNITCTNFIFGLAGFDANPETNCNDTADLIGVSNGSDFNFIVTGAGGGGMSNCTVSDQQTVASCSGGYPIPSWQVGPGVPTSGHRAVPDVSMFAGSGINYSFYIVCQQDATGVCDLASEDFEAVGGTSASAQVFGAIMAMVVQKYGAQGNPNPTLYKLAETQTLSNCNSSNSAAGTCIFYDTTNGTIAQPCAKGSPNCTVTSSGDAIGVLSGYSSTSGYDLATGLGSVNAANLVNNWQNTTNNGTADFAVSANPNTININAPGDTGTATLSFVSTNGFTGTIDLAASNCGSMPTNASCSFSPSSVSLAANGTATSTLTISTTAASHMLPLGETKPWGTTPLLLAIAGTLGFFVLAASRKQVRWSTALGVLAVGLLLMCGACGGGGSNNSGGGGGGGSGNTTPAGLYTGVTISVTSGSTTHTVPLTINVE